MGNRATAVRTCVTDHKSSSPRYFFSIPFRAAEDVASRQASQILAKNIWTRARSQAKTVFFSRLSARLGSRPLVRPPEKAWKRREKARKGARPPTPVI